MKTKRLLALTVAMVMCIAAFSMQTFAVGNVTFTALDGTANNGDNQGYTKLLDGSQNSKWCDKVGTEDGKTYVPYIVFEASEKVVITGYTFKAGNDSGKWTGRNPKDWTLYGCNDYDKTEKTGTWAAIHTVTNDETMPDANYAETKFTIENAGEWYQYYKLVITANHGAQFNLMQLTAMKIDYRNIFNITFDKNGGDTEANPKIIPEGDGLPTTNPTREGYEFVGWYTKNGADGDWGEQFTAESTVSEDTTIYAKWKQRYLVTFDSNGGTAIATNKIYHGDPIPTEIPTKADVKFGGWFTKNGTETGDWGEQYTADVAVTENITVYAKWNRVNITFDKNGGDTEANPNMISSGENLPSVNPTYRGHIFIGWYTKNGANNDWGEVFTKEMSDAALTDMTVYAKWQSVTITFDKNRGDTEPNPTQLLYGETPSTEPTKEGFTFVGWYTKNGANGDWGEKYPDTAEINEDTTVYAKWKANGADCIDNVTLTALSGTTGNNNESYDKLVDGKKIAGNASKWCVSGFTGSSPGAHIIIKASAYTIVTKYTFVTGNDTAKYSTRNPKNWVLYGCNDYDETEKTGTWAVIDSVTNDTTLGAKNFAAYSFSVDNTKAYKYYKLDITATKGHDLMQLSELEFTTKGCEHIFDDPVVTPPSCTVDGKTVYTCTKCDVSAINTVKATGHTLGENGKCSSCGETCGVKVGDAYYLNLQDAINAALISSTDNTVKLFQDIDITDTLNIGKGTATLDLNGHTINMTGSGSALKLSNYTNFTLDDSSTVKTGAIISSSANTTEGGGVYMDTGTMTIKGGTIKDCTARNGGGIYVQSGNLVISGGNVSNCTAISGGGIYIQSGILQLSGGTVANCKATGGNIGSPEVGGGGGIFVKTGKLVMSGGTITNCMATGYYFGYGGAIKSLSYQLVEINGGTISNCRTNNMTGGAIVAKNLAVTNGTITDCYAYKNGGAIYIPADFTAEISGGIISGNSTSTESSEAMGGGICNYGTLTVKGGEIKNNTANKKGGGIWTSGNATISGGIISGNTAKDGGGIYNCGTLNITNGEIKNNTANQKGGGLYTGIDDVENTTGNLTMSGGTISGNKAFSGGGICFNSSANGTISGGTISDNTSTGTTSGGGGILFINSTGTVSGVTISGNTSKGSMPYGGGGIMFDNSTVTVGNTLIKGNKGSDFGGGVLAVNSSAVKIENTQITENTAFGGGGVAVQTSSDVTVTGGKIFKNSANRGSGLRIDVAVVSLDGGVEISENGSTDGMYNGSNIYGAGMWASESTIYFKDANVIRNSAQKGGGVYVYDDKVFLHLTNGSITGNTATEEGGGISCKTDEIIIKGGIQISGNKLVSGTTQIENNVYLKNGTTMQVENPVTETDEGSVSAKIGVSVENGNSNVVAANNTDYSKYFTADSAGGILVYDIFGKTVKLTGSCTVTFDCGDENTFTKTVVRNTAVAEPTTAPTRDGYYFGGWYIGNTPYDFTNTISKDTVITAKWLEAGKFGISITPSKIYIVSNKANTKAYGAAYKGTQLVDIEYRDVVNYAVIKLSEFSLNGLGADTVSLFVWDGNLSPLCDEISFNIGG